MLGEDVCRQWTKREYLIKNTKVLKILHLGVCIYMWVR